MQKIVTRFAPSPSGYLTLGNARTMLYAYLYAKSKGGDFILRIEDSNAATTKPEYEAAIFDTLDWLGIKSDVPVIRQSDRAHIYKEYVDKLLASGHAYKCYCTMEELTAKRDKAIAEKRIPIYDRTCYVKKEQPGKPYVIRLKTPDHGRTSFKDLVFGKLEFLNVNMTDQVLVRQNGEAGYMITNTVDDMLQGVNVITRGQDGIQNAFFQIQLYEALGAPVPQFAHLPFVCDEHGKKLSKRDNDMSVLKLRDEGFLPEAVINGLARLGWSYRDIELISTEELIKVFDLRNVSRNQASLDMQKFYYINSYWMRMGDNKRITALTKPYVSTKTDKGPAFEEVVDLLRSRAKTLKELGELTSMFYKKPRATKSKLGYDFGPLIHILGAAPFDKVDELDKAIKQACIHMGSSIKELGPKIRKALTGRDTSPPIADIMRVLGRTETLARITKAI